MGTYLVSKELVEGRKYRVEGFFDFPTENQFVLTLSLSTLYPLLSTMVASFL